MRLHPSVGYPVMLLALAAGGLVWPAAAQAPKSNQTVVPTVAATSMKSLLPAPAGWTQGAVVTDKAVLSATCSYTFAYAAYTNGGMKVRMTIADTGFDEGALGALASMVMMFPDDHVGQIPPSTTIKRSVYEGSPAAELWDPTTGDGEFTVVVGGRFVVKAEGTHLPDISTARRFVEMVNIEKLKAVK